MLLHCVQLYLKTFNICCDHQTHHSTLQICSYQKGLNLFCGSNKIEISSPSDMKDNVQESLHEIQCAFHTATYAMENGGYEISNFNNFCYNKIQPSPTTYKLARVIY